MDIDTIKKKLGKELDGIVDNIRQLPPPVAETTVELLRARLRDLSMELARPRSEATATVDTMTASSGPRCYGAVGSASAHQPWP